MSFDGPQPPQPYGQQPSGQPPVPPYGAPSVPPYTVQQPGQTWNILAIVSLVSAFFVSLVAIVTGHIALSQIRRSGEKGRGLALAGVILGYAGVFFTLLGGIILLAVFVWGAGRAIENIPTDESTSSSSPSAESDLDWDAGQLLAASDRPEFLDPFATDPAWTVSAPDDGNGNWAYASADKQCVLKFHQGALSNDVVVATGDDRTTTKSYLEFVDGVTADDVDQLAQDDFVAFGTDGTAYADVLTLSGTDKDNNNWITAARAFTKTGTGLYLDLTCLPAADLDTYYYAVIDEAAVTVP